MRTKSEYQLLQFENVKSYIDGKITATEFHDKYWDLRNEKYDKNTAPLTPEPDKLWIIDSCFCLCDMYSPYEDRAIGSWDDGTLNKAMHALWSANTEEEGWDNLVKIGLLQPVPKNS